MVPNCKYYYNLSRTDAAIDAFGCFSCDFGYTGVIIGSDQISNYTGYIDSCHEINSVTNTLDADDG